MVVPSIGTRQLNWHNIQFINIGVIARGHPSRKRCDDVHLLERWMQRSLYCAVHAAYRQEGLNQFIMIGCHLSCSNPNPVKCHHPTSDDSLSSSSLQSSYFHISMPIQHHRLRMNTFINIYRALFKPAVCTAATPDTCQAVPVLYTVSQRSS